MIKLGFSLIALGLLSVWTLDKSITEFLYIHKSSYKWLVPILKLISEIGHYNAVFYIVSVVLVLGLFVKPIRYYTLVLSICLVLSDSAIMSLKFILGKARPELFLQKDIYGFYFFKSQKLYSSMPSGHTLLNSAIALSLYLKNKKIGLYLIIWSILVGISRILLFMHYFGDVLVSFGAGFLISILVIKLEKTYLDTYLD